MLKKFINNCISKYFHSALPTRKNTFSIQKIFLQQLLSTHTNSPLYQNLGIKQDQTHKDILSWTSEQVKTYLSEYMFCDYKNNILPFCNNNQGVVSNIPDLFIRTSGTSDANSGGKLIPAQWKSFDNERTGIKRTLSCYLKENPVSSVFFTTSFSLTAPFDTIQNIGYVSGAMRYANKKYAYKMFPHDDILFISDWNKKKETILQQLLDRQFQIGSFHGVPTRPLDIIQELIEKNKTIAKKILRRLEYVSIGGGPAGDYKQKFDDITRQLGLTQKIYGSNNHNASEGFLGSQVRNFSDLEYHWMSPVIQTNFFLFVPISQFDNYRKDVINYKTLIMSSHLLHEVEYDTEYLILFANHRIPRLYNIKDKVIFQKNDDLPDEDTILEYNVTGRYGMASNIFNEHIEVEHLLVVFDKLIEKGYNLSKDNFVAGMQLINNQGIFHIIIESDAFLGDSKDLEVSFDTYLCEVNDQWKLFRERGKIQSLSLSIVCSDTIRKGLIELGKMHEQSKLPHLSDKNFEAIVEPLLSYIKKE